MALNRQVGFDVEKEIAEITIYLAKRGSIVTEGSASPDELRYLVDLVKAPKVRLIGETGFNAGFSSYAFLKANPGVKVISFDIGKHKYVKAAKEYIDKKFPGRHTLIYGDSKETIPKFVKENPGLRSDLVFIDGGHDYETAKSDLVNLKALSTKKTAIVMDDLTPWLPWGKGPFRAWTEAIERGLITQKETLKDSKYYFNKRRLCGGRVWALGRYRF